MAALEPDTPDYSYFDSGKRAGLSRARAGDVTTAAGAGGGALAGSPALSNVEPTPGSIGRGIALLFDVTDPSRALGPVLVLVQYGKVQEVAWDGSAFVSPYLKSIAIPTHGGLHFQIRRTGGWVESPGLRVLASDGLTVIDL